MKYLYVFVGTFTLLTIFYALSQQHRGPAQAISRSSPSSPSQASTSTARPRSMDDVLRNADTKTLGAIGIVACYQLSNAELLANEATCRQALRAYKD